MFTTSIPNEQQQGNDNVHEHIASSSQQLDQQTYPVSR